MSWTAQSRLAWGRIPAGPQRVAKPRFADELPTLLGQGAADPHGVLVVGAGRSYDVSALNPGGSLIDAAGLDNLIAFDPSTGILRTSLWPTSILRVHHVDYRNAPSAPVFGLEDLW